jgi:hypothetical protein
LTEYLFKHLEVSTEFEWVVPFSRAYTPTPQSADRMADRDSKKGPPAFDSSRLALGDAALISSVIVPSAALSTSFTALNDEVYGIYDFLDPVRSMHYLGLVDVILKIRHGC